MSTTCLCEQGFSRFLKLIEKNKLNQAGWYSYGGATLWTK